VPESQNKVDALELPLDFVERALAAHEKVYRPE
jgi:hypothetical protein